MASKRVQHRAARETSNKENADLKKENKELKRTVARLQREIEKLNALQDEVSPTPEESKLPQVVELKCPACSSTKLSSITIPNGTLRYACKACRDWRGAL